MERNTSKYVAVAEATGIYNENTISATSNAVTVTACESLALTCERVVESFLIPNLGCVTQSYVYFNNVRNYEVEDMTFVRVVYGIAIKYLNSSGSQNLIKNEGVVVLQLPESSDGTYTVHIPNPPDVSLTGNNVTVSFMVALY